MFKTTDSYLTSLAEAHYEQAINVINCTRALRSPVIRQVCVDIVNDEMPGFFEAGGYLDFEANAVVTRIGYTDKFSLMNAKRPEKIGCDSTHLSYYSEHTFYCPQYGDCKIKINIADRQRLSEDDRALLVAIGKIEVSKTMQEVVTTTMLCGVAPVAPPAFFDTDNDLPF